MWTYKIIKQEKEIVQSDRNNELNGKPLPEGAMLLVDVEFFNELGDIRTTTIRLAPEDGIPLSNTVIKFIEQQKRFFEGKDEATRIIDNVKKIDEYLASI